MELPFVFDEGVIVDSRAAAIALVQKATETKLRQGENDSLVAELRKDPSISDDAKISASKIPNLIEFNPEIAKEVLVATAGKKPALIHVLQNLDITVAVADVVKFLVMNKKAGPNFLEVYISNATKCLVGIRDNQTMLRKARLFCKMMGFIVQNGEKLTPSTVLELNSFCEDPRAKGIKEAQELNGFLMNSN
jgi:hypothetical protein